MKHSSLNLAVSNRHFSDSILAAAVLLAVVCLLAAPAAADSAESDAHVLTATISGQGSISPGGTVLVAEGGSRSFVFDADENHRMVDLVVDGISVGPVDAFSFENVSASHTIEAVYEHKGTLTAESDMGM